MTTNTDVKNYKAVEEVNGTVNVKNGVELRKRKESFAKRQQSFQRQNSCGVDIDRPLTREDLRKSFGRSNTVSGDGAGAEAEAGVEKDEGGVQVTHFLSLCHLSNYLLQQQVRAGSVKMVRT